MTLIFVSGCSATLESKNSFCDQYIPVPLRDTTMQKLQPLEGMPLAQNNANFAENCPEQFKKFQDWLKKYNDNIKKQQGQPV